MFRKIQIPDAVLQCCMTSQSACHQ